RSRTSVRVGQAGCRVRLESWTPLPLRRARRSVDKAGDLPGHACLPLQAGDRPQGVEMTFLRSLASDLGRVGRFAPVASYQRFAYVCGALLALSGVFHVVV